MTFKMSAKVRDLLMQVVPEDKRELFDIKDGEELNLQLDDIAKWHAETVTQDKTKKRKDFAKNRMLRKQASIEQATLVKNRYVELFGAPPSSSSSGSDSEAEARKKKPVIL